MSHRKSECLTVLGHTQHCACYQTKDYCPRMDHKQRTVLSLSETPTIALRNKSSEQIKL